MMKKLLLKFQLFLFFSLINVSSAFEDSLGDTNVNTFYNTFGGESAFSDRFRFIFESFLEAEELYYQGDYTKARELVDAVWAQHAIGSVVWQSEILDELPDGAYADLPPVYNALRMLDVVIDYRLENGSKPAAKTISHTIIEVEKAWVNFPQNDDDVTNGTGVYQEYTLSTDVNEQIYRQCFRLMGELVEAMTDGALGYDIKVYRVTDPIALRYRFVDTRIGGGPDDPTDIFDQVPDSVKEKTDWWSFVYPEAAPAPTGDQLEVLGRRVVIGGQTYEFSSGKPAVIASDYWFTQKRPSFGDGPWFDVERRCYFPHWTAHEFFHYFYDVLDEFGLEDSSHQWFTLSNWPSDFEGRYEMDYYIESYEKRFATASPPMADRIEYRITDRGDADEAFDFSEDFTSDFTSPDVVDATTGEFSVSGYIARNQAPNSGSQFFSNADADAFTFNVPVGYEISQITVETSSLINGPNIYFSHKNASNFSSNPLNDNDGSVSVSTSASGLTDITSSFSDLGSGDHSFWVDISSGSFVFTDYIIKYTITPQGWRSQDIGSVAAVGSTSFNSLNELVLDGSGSDIWGTTDEFHFAYKTLSGDGEIVARMKGLVEKNKWTKAGVMIRETLDADSANAAIVVTPSRVSSQYRGTAGGTSNWTAGSFSTAPIWLKLSREGNTITSSESVDGVNWVVVDTITIAMGADVYAGIAVTSHNDGVVSTVVAENVEVLSDDLWLSQDIGAVSASGSTSINNGQFTIQASGSDIWSSSDEFHFVHQVLSGDGEITARTSSLVNTHSWAKAGVMIRESLDANAKNVAALVTPGQGISSQYRTTTGGNSSWQAGTNSAAPHWVRLSRVGNVFTSSESNDGINWTVFNTVTISMNIDVHIGLAVTSHNDGTLTAAVFDNVELSTPTVGGSSEVGVLIDAIGYDNESDPGNENVIRNMGTKIGFIQNGAWVSYDAFNFGSSGVSSIQINAATPSSGGTIEVRLGSPTGNLIASVSVSNTGGWDDFSPFNGQINQSVFGAQDLYLIFVGSGALFDVQSFEFN